MPVLTSLLAPHLGKTAVLVGSGGKTTLLWQLAQAFRSHSVLVTTTTKIAMPAASGYYDIFGSATTLPQTVDAGVHLLCERDSKSGKLCALPAEVLAGLIPQFLHIFIEGDGSNRLPYKGWASHEPVVPEFATATIGVLPVLKGIVSANETSVHRLPLFCTLSGATPGQPLSPAHLAKVVAHPNGLFAKAQGKKILFLNQADSPANYPLAQQILEMLPPSFLVQLGCVVAGSAKKNEGIVLWEPSEPKKKTI